MTEADALIDYLDDLSAAVAQDIKQIRRAGRLFISERLQDVTLPPFLIQSELESRPG